MKLELAIIDGPHLGKKFVLEGHDTFLVGRAKDAHFQLSNDDPYFSRRHFLIEMNPPRCRVIDLSRRNGILHNGTRVQSAEIADGDEVRAGHTVFEFRFIASEDDEYRTLDTPMTLDPDAATDDYKPFSLAIPGYDIEGELGRGGMGVVYQAKRQRDGRAAAVKTIIPATGASERQVQRFLRECRTLGRLDHPNIVAFHEMGKVGGVVYLVMDMVVGLDLGQRVRQRGPEDIRTGVRIACQILKGLAHAHDKGFVHRDIRPSNVLIGQIEGKPTATLADFGLARLYETSQISGLTMQGEVGGTPAFMAPEQVTHYRDVKPPADQYSAAATLYFVLTGKNVHDLPREVGDQFALIVSAEPVPICERRADVPAGLATVIHKALSREPGERYVDVGAFRTALKRFA